MKGSHQVKFGVCFFMKEAICIEDPWTQSSMTFAPDAVNDGLVLFDLRSPFSWPWSGGHTWIDAPLSIPYAHDPKRRAIRLRQWSLHSARDPLSFSQRARPRT